MSGPETQAGRALLAAGNGEDPVLPDDWLGAILAIEAESATRVLTDLREAIGSEPPEASDYEAGVWAEWFRILALIDDAIAAQKGAS